VSLSWLIFIVPTTKAKVRVEWYWDEITYEYDDDVYSTEYWDYDWESVWSEYAYVTLSCFVTTDGCVGITHTRHFHTAVSKTCLMKIRLVLPMIEPWKLERTTIPM
jgi:hypothetical protein